MPGLSVVVAGAVLGVRHALETDHLAAVATLVSSAPSIDAALVFLGGFSCLSILTVALVSTLWGRTLGTTIRRGLEGAAGALGVVVGATPLLELAVGATPSDRAWRSPQTLP